MYIEKISAVFARRCREIDNSLKEKYSNVADLISKDQTVFVPSGTIGTFETLGRYKRRPIGRYRFTGKNGSFLFNEEYVVGNKNMFIKCS